MKRRMAGAEIALTLIVSAGAVFAAESASFKMEGVLNAGGRPDDGVTVTSAGFHVTIDSLGDGIVPRPLSSASYRIDSGFAGAFPPPGEVLGLRFVDLDSIEWDAERSVGVYHLYRGAITDLDALGFGSCTQPDLTGTTTTDEDVPVSGQGFFYLVTAENRLGEHGTKGTQGDMTERLGEVCP